MQLLRSLLFNLSVYVVIAAVGLWYAPQAVFRRDKAVAACKAVCRYVRWSAPWMVGLRTEVRGPVPQGEVLVAAKHQSFLDIFLIYGSLPNAKFIMKDELRYAPVVGWFAMRVGCVPVKRGRRAEAMRRMVAEVAAGREVPGQLVIYPQGTRVAPGASRPYKAGTYVLYKETGQPCVPVGCNVGVFWPRRGVLRRPGTAVVEFGEPIPPGLGQEAFMERLEREVEASSDRLMAEAGFRAPSAPGPLAEG
ncbi:1-acyl-sn-glycerol-3-phosphate acyltransferase [Hasllibacter halocynthiae]|uniref:1-acyl-sn-glycerol-3-phosphate acyltransferase n=1 Tax=Hasllibacter halocynthiae TaxID=595589 RepID=A0A2T0X452_9RHOB|nr:lysophospholipid acyltransferase family protein [Hasllibacter halocynthiae]PRY93644.1 1-acyl-sn-glycerol-3-phosphate acyltransferase [Hasllibacter halocynthiae]